MRVAVYLRQSLDREGAGLAVDRQRAACRALCAEKGWEAVEYVDNSVSASSRKPRPAYQRMLEDIRAGVVRGVVVWDLDRLHRQPAELETFIPLAEEYGLALATVTGDTDLATDNGRLFARIKGAVARAEVERKSARQKAAHQQRAAAGKPWTTRRPFGFQVGGMEHEPSEAELIRGMYADALAGTSQSAIARRLNEQGVTTSLGNKWTQASVRGLLMNPRNAGLRSYRGEIVGVGKWEPIVTEDVWRGLVQRFTSNAPRKGGGGLKYMLAGLARCDVCGAKVRTAYTNRGVRLYICPSTHVARKAESVDDLVTEVALARLGLPDAQELLVADDEPDGAAAAAEVQAARDALDALAEMYAAGDLTLSAFKSGNERGKARLAAAEAAMPRRAGSDALQRVVSAADPRATWGDLDLARRRAIVETLMDVHIEKTGRGARFDPDSIRIEWRHAAPAEVSLRG